jgi:two-component system chemotaxis sensor kinase CheA
MSGSEKALQEFLSEAQEIVETYNRALLRLEDRASGRFDPDALNDAFRAVHSLKGLSGLFAMGRMTALSHNLENLLDALRLGKVELSPEVLDLVFETVEQFGRLVAEARAGGGQGESAEGAAVDRLVHRIDRVVGGEQPVAVAARSDEPWGGYELDASLISVLTEYEEHRLRENIKSGRALYRIHAAFDLMTIDKGLEDLKTRLKTVGEVITYLPSSESRDDQKLDLDVIVGSGEPRAAVEQALAGVEVVLRDVPRGEPRSAAPRRDGPAAAGVPAPLPGDAGLAQDRHDELEERSVSLRSMSQTVRVDIRKLDHLLNVVGELGLVRAGIQTVLDELKQDRGRTDLARILHREARSLGRKLDELQAGILEVRMVPLGQVFEKLSRIVRKLSRDAGKEIRFVISGAETELDKLIVEELSDPLMHIIRNAIDHAIESPAVRAAAGKPPSGTIAVTAAQRGNHVMIEVEDDGAGIDEQKLIRRAIEAGHLDETGARELTRRDAYNLMFVPGLSTKDAADELSGRGVGMDVVKTNISRLSGIIDVESEPGQGTRLTITLPITLAIIQALVVRVAGRTYALPLSSVLESLLLAPEVVRTVERCEVIDLRGATLPTLRLEEAFSLARDKPLEENEKLYVVVVGIAQHRIGLIVDELVGQQDIVIKSLGRALEGIPGVAGATELGNQQTVLVLDVAALVEETLHQTVEAA